MTNMYEQQRLDNIKRNKERLAALNIQSKLNNLSDKRPRFTSPLESSKKYVFNAPSHSNSKEQSGPSRTSRHSENVLPKKRPLPEVSLHEDSESPSDSDDDVQSVPSQPIKKKGRGRTKMLPSWGIAPLDVELNELYQPIGDNAAKLASQMGRKVKNGAVFPLTVRDWRKIDQHSKDTTWLEFKANFTLEEDYKKDFLKKLGHQWKDWKAHVKKNYYLPHKDDGDALLDNRPMEVEFDQWLALICYWNSDSAKLASRKNKVNRSQQRVAPRTGKNSFAVVKNKMEKQNGEEPSNFDFWMATHVEAAKTPFDKKTDKFVKKLTRLISKDPEAMKSKEKRDQILVKLLGPEKSGQMRSFGFGPTQSQISILKKQKKVFNNKVSHLVENIREGLKEELKAELHDVVKEIVVELLQSLKNHKDLDTFLSAGGTTNDLDDDED